MAVQSKQFKQISSLAVARDSTGTFGSTVLTAAAAAGASTLTVSAITNFAVGDLIRVGSGEDTELVQLHASTAPTGSTITLATALLKAHANGEPVVEQTMYDLGDVADSGVEVTLSGESTDVEVSTKRLTYAVLSGYVDMAMRGTLPGVSLYNFAMAFGLPFSRITTNGSVVAVTGFVEDGNNFNAELNQSVIVKGTLNDGTTFKIELWGCQMDYTGISLAMSRGQAGGVPLRFVGGGGGVISTAADAYSLVTTYKPSKGHVFDAVSEIGYFATSVTTTTVASGGAAAANTVTLTSAAGFAVGDWVKYGSGENAEYHQIDAIATNTLTNRSKFLRSQAAATAVMKVTATALPGLNVAGATFSAGGSVTPIRVATQRRTAGLRSGNAQVTVAFAITDFSLANWQQAAAAPSAALAGGRLTLDDRIGTSPTDGVYLKGTLLDGTTFWITCWGCSQDIANLVATLNGSGDAPSIPFAFRPASGFSLLNHA